jgi:hypothetical protein
MERLDTSGVGPSWENYCLARGRGLLLARPGALATTPRSPLAPGTGGARPADGIALTAWDPADAPGMWRGALTRILPGGVP